MGSSAIRVIIKGQTGPTGPTGSTGPTGTTGTGTGLTGATGRTGFYITDTTPVQNNIIFSVFESTPFQITGTRGPTGYTGTVYGQNTGGGFTLFSGISGYTLTIRGLSFYGNIKGEVTGNSILVTPLDVYYGPGLSSGITTDRVLFSEKDNLINSSQILYGKTYGEFSFLDYKGISFDPTPRLKPNTLNVSVVASNKIVEIPSGENDVVLNVSDSAIFKIKTPIGITAFSITGSHSDKELISFTMFVEGSGFSQFPENVYFENTPYSSYFSCGMNIVNVMSYDLGQNWFATISERGFGSTLCENFQGIGSCCYKQGNTLTCEEYVNNDWCKGKSGSFNFFTPCELSCGPTAICCSNGNCVENVSKEECEYFGGNYYSGLTCAGYSNPSVPNTIRQCYNSNLPTTSCCTGGQCIPNVTWKICQDYYRGVPFTGSCCDLNCSATPPRRISGACCSFNTETCEDTTPSGCSASNGIFYGDGTTCGGIFCCYNELIGTCCSPYGCHEDISRSECCRRSGSFYTDGRVCSDINCSTQGITGACCRPTTPCSINSTYETCVTGPNSNALFFPGRTSCSPIFCSTQFSLSRACCLPTGCCVNVPLNLCARLNGIAYSEALCSGVSCSAPPVAGSCCSVTGECTSAYSTTCPPPSVFRPNIFCMQQPCSTPPTPGVCCITPGTCVQSNSSTCLPPNTFIPNGNCLQCSDPPVTGACCVNNTTCTNNVLESTCQQLGGVFTANTDCASISCNNPVSACCLPSNGGCIDTTSIDCSARGGDFREGVLCSSQNCNTVPPGIPEKGLCCVEDGNCSWNVTRQECYNSHSGFDKTFYPNILFNDWTNNLYEWDENDCAFCNLHRYAILTQGKENSVSSSSFLTMKCFSNKPSDDEDYWSPRKTVNESNGPIQIATTKIRINANTHINPECGSIEVKHLTGSELTLCMKDSFLSGQIFTKKYKPQGAGGGEEPSGLTSSSPREEFLRFIYNKYLADINWVWGDYSEKLCTSPLCSGLSGGTLGLEISWCIDEVCTTDTTKNNCGLSSQTISFTYCNLYRQFSFYAPYNVITTTTDFCRVGPLPATNCCPSGGLGFEENQETPGNPFYFGRYCNEFSVVYTSPPNRWVWKNPLTGTFYTNNYNFVIGALECGEGNPPIAPAMSLYKPDQTSYEVECGDFPDPCTELN